MSKGKNYNSIVFLTTLSVYLGLVLVGGAIPTVLAQAALTRDFDIKNEIVFEDDLDKKPDEDDVFDSDFIYGPVLELLSDLKKLKQIEKYNGEQYFEIDFLFKRYEKSNRFNVEKIQGGGNIWVHTACEEPAYLIEHQFDLNTPSNFYIYDKKLKVKVTNTNVKFVSENGDFSLQINSTQESNGKAQELAKFFNDAFIVASSNADLKNYEKLVYQNTKATSENNQVLIVTRLPRASIDELLAEKDSQ